MTNTYLNWTKRGGRRVVDIIRNGRLVACFFDMRDAEDWCAQ